MSRVSLVAVLAVATAIIGCSKESAAPGAPAGPARARALPAMQAAEAAQAGQQPPPAATAAPPKPVPAELPDVLARVNGDAITKADFERALAAIEQRAGGPVPAERRDEIFRGLLDQLVRLQAAQAGSRGAQGDGARRRRGRSGSRRSSKQFPSEDVFKQMLAAQKMTLDEAARRPARSDLAINRSCWPTR